MTFVWPVAGISSVFVFWHLVQAYFFSPFSVQVAGVTQALPSHVPVPGKVPAVPEGFFHIRNNDFLQSFHFLHRSPLSLRLLPLCVRQAEHLPVLSNSLHTEQ